MRGALALVLAEPLGPNLRFKGSPLCDRPHSSIWRPQRRSRQAPSEHARPVLGQRTTVVIEQIPCLCADISVRHVSVAPLGLRYRLDGLLRASSSGSCRSCGPLMALPTIRYDTRGRSLSEAYRT